MTKKRIIICLTFLDGVLFRTKKFIPDYRYTKNFIDLWSIDELILIDISKMKFSKNFLEIVNFYSKNCFVPISVGGGISSLSDVDLLYKNGADKIILGSDKLFDQNLSDQITRKYGNQSLIQSLDFKMTKNVYEVFGKSSTKKMNLTIKESILKSMKNGVGEILVNNIDRDGSLLGYDLDLVSEIKKFSKNPILVLGGAGNWQHILDLFKNTDVSGACTQNIFHFTENSIASAKKFLIDNGIHIRS